MYTSLVVNFDTSAVREETLHGRKYWVVNMVSGKEGVLPGSRGPGYYPKEEWAKGAELWNHKPIVVYHPTKKDENGVEKPISAADPEVLGKQQIGFTLNSRYEDGLKQEAWIEQDLAKKVDTRVYDAIRNKTSLEVSTGLIVDDDKTTGVWNGVKYEFVARNHRPNHVAVLPDEIGACSMTDGCGLLVNCGCGGKVENKKETPLEPIANELSFSDINQKVQLCLYDKFTKDAPAGYYFDGYVVDVFDGFAIYRAGGKYFRIDYSVENDQIKLTGEPKEVARVTEYRLVGNSTYVGTTTGDFVSNQEKAMADKFNRKTKIDALIANGVCTEADRPELEKTPDLILEKWAIPEKKEPTVNTAEKKEPTLVVNKGDEAKEMTEEEWLKDPRTPRSVKDIYLQNKQAVEARRTALVKVLVDNEACPFQEPYLNAQPVDVLEGLVAMLPATEGAAAPVQNAGGVLKPSFQTNYGVSAPVPVTNRNPKKAVKVEPMVLGGFSDN
jgi:hypothetical protein